MFYLLACAMFNTFHNSPDDLRINKIKKRSVLGMLSSFGIDGNYSFSLQAIDVGRFSDIWC